MSEFDSTRFNLTKSDAISLLETAVAERGEDFHYRQLFGAGDECDYAAPTLDQVKAHTDESGEWVGERKPIPACIVGVGLAQRGITVEQLDDLTQALPIFAGWENDRDPASSSGADFFATVGLDPDRRGGDLALVGFTATENAARVLWAAQSAQDKDRSWGDALMLARQVAALLDGE